MRPAAPPLQSVLFAGDTETTRVHFADVKPLEKQTREAGGVVEKAGTKNNNTSNNNNSNKRGDTSAGFLRVMHPSFNLNMAASSARRTSPRLLLATGERANAENDAPGWFHRTAGDNEDTTDDMEKWANGDETDEVGGANTKKVGFLARGEARAGTRTPAWKDGEFWLSLEGIDRPALFVALEDGKKAQEGRHVSEDALLAEACIPLPLGTENRRGSDGGRSGWRWSSGGGSSSGTFEAELRNGAGVVTLQWSRHENTSSMKPRR